MAQDAKTFSEQFIGALPHARALGIEVIEVGAGEATLRMGYREELIGDPDKGVIHGGAVSALMDTCGGLAVALHPQSAGGTATIDLRIDYMRGATPGQPITARAHCYHVTRTVAFVRAQAFDADPDAPVASATGAFTFERRA